MDTRKIGKHISELRKQKGITQLQLAGFLNTSQSAVGRIERGGQNLSAEMIAKISKALNKNIITLADGKINFKIKGGHRLSGVVTTNTSKNSTVALLCASLLNKGITVLKNIPKIEEVNRIIEVLESMGVDIKWVNKKDIKITPPLRLNLENINSESASKTRSILMLIPSLTRFLENFKIPVAGGCKLGSRTIAPHQYALEKLGISIKESNEGYIINATRPQKNAEIILYESGDTVTENAIMAAAKIPAGRTVIKFASANYQVQDLCKFMEKLGVRIEGVGTTTLTIHGRGKINEKIEYYPCEDPIESMLFLSAAAITGSIIEIKKCPIDFLQLELLKLEKMGFRFKLSSKYKSQNGFTDLVDIKTYPSKLKALKEKIYGRPYPGLNIDNLPFFIPLATQAKGETLIHDWVYENRAMYYLELAKMGADLILADPHRLYVKGPTPLKSTDITCPPALRPAAIILIAMLRADGTSILRNVYSINRGYENLSKRLNKLGAKIEIIQDYL